MHRGVVYISANCCDVLYPFAVQDIDHILRGVERYDLSSQRSKFLGKKTDATAKIKNASAFPFLGMNIHMVDESRKRLIREEMDAFLPIPIFCMLVPVFRHRSPSIGTQNQRRFGANPDRYAAIDGG